jgi:hypothetical protein
MLVISRCSRNSAIPRRLRAIPGSPASGTGRAMWTNAINCFSPADERRRDSIGCAPVSIKPSRARSLMPLTRICSGARPASRTWPKRNGLPKGVHQHHPGKLMAYNCSASFNWRKKLDDSTIARFQRELAAMGYKFQFITLAGFHALKYSMFSLARGFNERGMSAFCRTAGSRVCVIISGGESSTTALHGERQKVGGQAALLWLLRFWLRPEFCIHRAHLAQNRSQNQAFEGGCFKLLGSPDPRLFGALGVLAAWFNSAAIAGIERQNCKIEKESRQDSKATPRSRRIQRQLINPADPDSSILQEFWVVT